MSRFCSIRKANPMMSVRSTACMTRFGNRPGAEGANMLSDPRPDTVPALLASLAPEASVGAARAAVPLRRSIDAPADAGGPFMAIDRTVGISMASASVVNRDTHHWNAGAALYRPKADIIGQFPLGCPEAQDATQANRLLELDLRAALAAKHFELLYAPMIDLRTRRVSGLEAMLRWRHPRHGDLRPATLVSFAEKIGLIGEIGEWQLRQGCLEAAGWPEEVNVAVNVSAMQFCDAALPTIVFSALQSAGLRPTRLELEITNSLPIARDAVTLACFGELRDAGVRITADGFGAGEFVLGRPAGFPFDKIKIERSLISRLARGQSNTQSALGEVRAIAGLCASLGVGCAADGVETEEQYGTLVNEGCIEVQGSLFGRPKVGGDVPNLLRRMNGDGAIAAAAPADQPSSAISFHRMAETASDIVIITDANANLPGPTILYVNPAFTWLTGYTADESVGRSPRFLQGPGTSRNTLDAIGAALRAGRLVSEKVLNFAKSGTPYWIDMRIAALRDSTGTITNFAAIERDVTLDRRRLQELEVAADRDPLTGILNRRAVLRVIEAEIESAQSRGGATAGAEGPCVAFIDIDNFKDINDILGHAAGDAVLYGLTDRLAEQMRRSDTLGRIGGEEFAVCIPGVGLNDGERLAERLRQAIADAAFQTPCGPVPITVSIGTAVFTEGDNVMRLIERADSAMYAAKRIGRDRVTAINSRQQCRARQIGVD